jgi:hypothetical protein
MATNDQVVPLGPPSHFSRARASFGGMPSLSSRGVHNHQIIIIVIIGSMNKNSSRFRSWGFAL